MNTGGPASKMTVLDKFAESAMKTVGPTLYHAAMGYTAEGNQEEADRFPEHLATLSYIVAAAMLAEKERREKAESD